MRRRLSRYSDERGFALLAVLWAAIMLAIIVASLLASGRTQSRIARNLSRVAAREATADAAINGAILGMLSSDRAAQPPTDATTFIETFAGTPVDVSIADEAGKVDLNEADGTLLNRLLQVGGLSADDAQMMSDRIQDWRDRSGLHRLDGAGQDAYRKAGLGYGPRHGRFPAVSELRLVLGMDPRVFDRIAPSLTVVAGTPWIDPTYAGHDVLLALPDANEASVQATLAARASAPRPGVTIGHAYTITATIAGDGSRMIRRAVIRLTGDRTVPVWIYTWDRVTQR